MNILSKRQFESWPSYDLVYEWEDEISKILSVPIKDEHSYLYNRILKRIPLLTRVLQTNKDCFIFEMSPVVKNRINNKKNIIPCIIDYYLADKYLSDFIFSYIKNKIVCISSKEVYGYLIDRNVDSHLNLFHLPLSISDKYEIKSDTTFEKKYDLVLMGRQNSVLESFLKRYVDEHRDFNYVYRKQIGKSFMYYTSKGECIGDINTRQKYMNLMRQAKCGLYATPGIDGGEKRTNGFNQVTPRFLELLACGCHIIARYPKNSDTQFFQIERFSKSIETYEEFEIALNYARENEVDMCKYSEYLSKHYTSQRAKLLSNLLKNL